MNSTCMPNAVLTSQSSILTTEGNSSTTHGTLGTSKERIASSSYISSQPTISYEGRLSVLARGSFDIEPIRNLQDNDKRKQSGNLSLSVSVTSVDEVEKKQTYLSHNTSSILSDTIKKEDPLERLQEICEDKAVETVSVSEGLTQVGDKDKDTDESSKCGPFTCHLCTYSSCFRDEFNSHVNSHYEFRCQKCDFMTKDENDYRAHLKSLHDLTPEAIEDEQGVRVPRINSQGKIKTFKCKQCDFVSVTKKDFWQHTKEHMKPDKMLQCPKCPFVTEYKHHMEYHVRNHFGSKPYKCPNCNYSCVNKSMLNSHMKSHTNIYQYRCLDCTYATKYCHSLKLHLRKYGHKPSVVLNADGTPNPLPIIDVYGTRRGPKVKKDDTIISFPPVATQVLAQMPISPSSIPASSSKMSDLSSAYFNDKPISYTPLINERGLEEKLKCNICDFETTIPDIYENHMILHEHKENDTPSPENSLSQEDNEDLDQNDDKEEIKNQSHSERIEFPVASARDYLEYFKQYASLATQVPLGQPLAESDQEPPTSRIGSNEMLSRWYLESVLKRFQKSQTPDSEMDNYALDLSQAQELVNASTLTNNGNGSVGNIKNRRKGKAFRIKRNIDQVYEENEARAEILEYETSQVNDIPLAGNFLCTHCDIAFTCSIMHKAHMSYHDAINPLKCSICCQVLENNLNFFLHITKKAHISIN